MKGKKKNFDTRKVFQQRGAAKERAETEYENMKKTTEHTN